MIIVYTVFPNKSEAAKIARALVSNKLAACVNIFPLDSCFQWEGKIVRAKEYGAFIKTAREKFSRVEAFIVKNHSYRVPCVVELPTGRVLKAYGAWVKESLLP